MISAVGAAQAKVKSQAQSTIPSRIILSRKGWDSKAGGFPNPILPDGFPLSLPIPDGNSRIRYGDLYLPDGRKAVGEMVRQLSKGKWGAQDEVHLDPDIRKNAIPRVSFRAAFGQSGAAQTHLHNQNVRLNETGQCNDLFLYFGRYRQVVEENGHWRYGPGALDVQLIFGWLQVGNIIPLSQHRPEWASYHPHCVVSRIVRVELGNKYGTAQDNNTLYAARSELSFCDQPGAGVFQHFDARDRDPKRLTSPKGPASRWKLPGFFRREVLKPFSNIGDKAGWQPDGDSWIVQRRGPGQEFVLETKGREREVLTWLQQLFATA